MGLIGFDSMMEWYVSMQSVDGRLFNPGSRRIYLATTLMLSQLNRSIVD